MTNDQDPTTNPDAVPAPTDDPPGAVGPQAEGASTDPSDHIYEIPDLPPDLIDGFELLERVAEGGMGAVFRATQVSLDRDVAIKVLKPRLALDDSFLTRFNREAKAVARLNHPCVVRAIDVGSSQGWHYLVMEYVNGRTLQARLDEEGMLPEKEAIRIGWQVCRALNHAHANGLVHRDIKPENVLITESGDAKVCDLGLVKDTESTATMLTVVGTAMGTPHYVSPEQASGKSDVDIRSDIYSLGATFYHMVTGRPPFVTGNAATLMARHMSEEPTPVQMRNPKISNGTAAVIEKMLEKKPEDRYQTPRSVMAALRRVASGQRQPVEVAGQPEVPPTAEPPDDSESPQAPTRRRTSRYRRGRRRR